MVEKRVGRALCHCETKALIFNEAKGKSRLSIIDQVHVNSERKRGKRRRRRLFIYKISVRTIQELIQPLLAYVLMRNKSIESIKRNRRKRP